MEQHAVPQDITGFKFKLVGDMTLKQFGELAAGAILAWMFFASTWHPFLKWPFVLFFLFLGVALAFIPIEERPLDLWIFNFFRAIYRPTFYVWKKDASGSGYLESSNLTTKPPVQKPLVLPEPIEEPVLGLAPWPFEKEKTETAAEKKEPVVEEPDSTAEPKISDRAETEKAVPSPATPPQPTQPAAAPTPPSLSVEELQKLRDQKLAELDQAKKTLQEATKQAKEEVFKTQVGPSAVTVDQLAKMRTEKMAQQDQAVANEVATGETQLAILISQNKVLMEQIEAVKNRVFALSGGSSDELKTQLAALTDQKNQLAGRIKALQDELATQRAAPLAQPAYQQPRVVATPTAGVKVMDRPLEKQTTISLSDQPNIISGMIVNEKGAPVDGVIVLIKDKAGNSIRALKTNKVGQFVVATPMENGTYYVELEKAGYNFSVLEIVLTGQVLAPLEIPAQTVVASG